MAEWWQEEDAMSALLADPDVKWHDTGWVDPETGEKTDVPFSGVSSEIHREFNPVRQAEIATYESTAYQDFIADLETTERGRRQLHGWTDEDEVFHGGLGALELWRQQLRHGVPGGPVAVFMEDYVPPVGGTDDDDDDGLGPSTVGTTGGIADDTVRREMELAFINALQMAGLDPNLIKTLWTWAENKLVTDPSFTAQRALLEMYQHEAFETRFPAIKAMHDAGVTRRDIPTPGDYILYEKELVKEMNRAGINADDVTLDTVVKDLLVGRVGMDEVVSRLDEAKRMMYNVPAAVKEIFLDWAPTDSEGKTTYPESSLMLAFLDPDDKWSDIQEQIAAAETAGGAKLRAGLDISREMAERIANVSNDQAAIWTQFANLKQKEALFAETLTEDVKLEMGTHGVTAEFQLEGIGEGEDYMTGLELSDLLTRRTQTRQAAFSGGGGAMVTAGQTGFGAVNA
jgi:hypothetical protein